MKGLVSLILLVIVALVVMGGIQGEAGSVPVDHAAYVYERALDSEHPATVVVEVEREVHRCRVWITTRSFRAISRANEASGAHQHMVFDSTNVIGHFQGQGYYSNVENAAGAELPVLLPDTYGDVYTYEGTGGHTHAIAFGIVEDDEAPGRLRIAIDGTDRTAALGGPWAVGGDIADFAVDIGEYLDLGRHTIEVMAGDGQGMIEIVVDLYSVS
jgi:hypothetical protein